jgi:hypothetical protein
MTEVVPFLVGVMPGNSNRLRNAIKMLQISPKKSHIVVKIPQIDVKLLQIRLKMLRLSRSIIFDRSY